MIQDFLSRWSRRKQAAAQAVEQSKPPPAAESGAAPAPAMGSAATQAGDASGAAPSAGESCAPAFDPASLPPIESITAETDIRAFFGAGVPADLTRAALRRAWASDPKIRDFVGLADYDWDFNAPGAMAGFGPLEAADALRVQTAHGLGGDAAGGRADAAAQQAPVSSAPPAQVQNQDQDQDQEQDQNQVQIITEDAPPRRIGKPQGDDELTRPHHRHTAVQQQDNPEKIQSFVHRRHGRALPEA
jgi:hypothetical protein